MKKKKIIVGFQGAWEILNVGHVKSFKRAKAQGDYLILFLNSDELLKEYKGRDAVQPFAHKKEILEAIRYVDKVVKANEFSPLKLLKKHKVDVYVLTREWESTKEKEIAYMKKKGGKISFSPRYKGVIATSEIKRILLKEAKRKQG